MYEDRATFYTALSAFLEDGENTRFESDVVFNDDGTILVSRRQPHTHTDSSAGFNVAGESRELPALRAILAELSREGKVAALDKR